MNWAIVYLVTGILAAVVTVVIGLQTIIRGVVVQWRRRQSRVLKKSREVRVIVKPDGVKPD
jgi:hypothetical protein